MARETVRLLTRETPDFITPALWPANSPDLNPVDYQKWGKHRSRMNDADYSWSHTWSKKWEHFYQLNMKRSGSGVHVFQLAFEHTEDILNTYFSYVWYLYRRTLRQSYVCAVGYSGHYCFGGDLTKPAITIAICKRWQIVLKFVNLFPIRHCIVGPEFC